MLGLFLNVGLEELQVETHTLTAQRAKDDEEKKKIDRSLQFLQAESYHDVRFPGLKTRTEPSGLEYTIEPVRDGETGEPKRRTTEMETCYVVKVRGPAQEEVREPDNLAEYQNAPIHTGEFYFCRLYNGEWHMGQDAIGFDEWRAFCFSGKVGPIQSIFPPITS